MIYISKNVKMRMADEIGMNHLEFKFKGHFSQMESRNACIAWTRVFDKNPEMTYSLIWNCTEMSGFDPEARKAWYSNMKQHKSRIIDVVVVSRSLLIRSAARVMLEFFGLGTRIVKSKEDLLQFA